MVTGTLKSEPSFPVPLDLVFHSPGSDFIHGDPGGEHMRLDAHAILKDVSSETSGDAKPGMVYINYKGIVDITPALGLVLGGDPAAKTTEWGGSFVEAKFETGAEKFKILEQGIFVAAGRFVVEKEKRTVVEYRFSQVCM
ncbi:hypothetical protein MMC25_001710 [Agyrium rufum]|nr:hypothetical protein [Agyrium rufum]